MSTKPRFAYMILTHKDPEQVEELSDRVLQLSSDGQVVIHHDLAADTVPWRGRPPSRVHLVDRSRVLWGDWSIVEATLRMVRFSLNKLNADWLVVLSGEHRPVVDLGQWEQATNASGKNAFVEAGRLPVTLRFGRRDDDGNRFLARCTHRWVTINEPRVSIGHRALGGVWKLSRYVQPLVGMEYSHRRRAWFIGIPRSRGPLRDWAFYKGSQWMAFDRRAAEALLGTDPAINDWFRLSHIPDETYFHTVLHHQPGLVVSNQIVTYVPPGPERPTAAKWMVLDRADLPAVWASGAAFARKVDAVSHPDVIRSIDDEVDRQRGTPLLPRATMSSKEPWV